GVTSASRQFSGGAGRCCTSAKRYSRSSCESWSVDEILSSTAAETWMSRPCSSQVYQVTLTPASAATSSRRRPGVRLRSASGRPTSLGETLARQLFKNSLSCLFRESIELLHSAAEGVRADTGACWECSSLLSARASVSRRQFR